MAQQYKTNPWHRAEELLNLKDTHYDKNTKDESIRISKGAKIKNRYNQVPHLTQDTNRKVTNSQLDTTNVSQEVSPFPAGDHKAHITDAYKGIANTRQKKHKRSTKEAPPWNRQ